MYQHPVRVRGAHCAAAALFAIGLATAPCPAAAQSAAGRDAFTAEAEVQRALLEQDVADYRAARRAEVRAREALEEALAGYDQAIRPRRLALADVEAAGDAVAAARARLGVAAADSARLSAAIHDRLRALAVLDGRTPAEAATVPPGGIDLTGRWRVAVAPQGLLGTFHLDQDGAVVTGTYTLTDGSGGSLRGSISGRMLQLERIDRSSGFDSVYHATVDPTGPRIDGTWTPTILSSGGPGGGTWSAVPAGSAAAEELEPAPPEADELDEEDLGDETFFDEDDIEDGAFEDGTPPDEEIP
jgi:hypothetical protein